MVTPAPEAHLSDQLFDRQIRAAARVAPIGNMAHALTFVYVGIWVLPTSLQGQLAWMIGGVGLSGFSLRWALGARLPARRIFHEMLGVTVLFGLLWTAATLLILADGDRENQILLTGLIAAVIGAGAIALSTHRVVGLAWVASMSLGPLVLFVVQNDRTLAHLAVLLVIYDLAMMVGVLYLSGSFRARCVAEQEAEVRRADLQLLLDDFETGAREWLWETHDGYFRQVSERFSQMTRRAPEDLERLTLPGLLQTLQIHQWPEGRAAVAAIDRSLRSGEPFADLVVPVRIGRERRWWSLSGKKHTGGRWRGLGADLTESVLARQRIERLATTDPITGLANRQALNAELAERLKRVDGGTLYLGLVDLDNFKTVNDTLGHPAGDHLIVQVAASMSDELQDGEFCARFGGDEFAVILPDGLTAEAAAARFDLLHRAIKQHSYTVEGNVLAMTSSIGVASSADADGRASALISCADLALYAAKGDGRDRVQFWTPELSEGANRRAELVQDITRGIEENQFETYWQPQIDSVDGSVVGLEALIRWNHPRLGVLIPSQFLQVATESGLIVRMGQLSLEAVLEAATSWAWGVRLSLNVSARELLSFGFVDHLIRRVAEAGVSTGRLVLEVTEDAVLAEESQQSLTALRDAGFQISMDDFGTGYSSFALLARMKFDEIKIDRSLVRPLPDDLTFRTLVQTVIDMARALGATVIAEGVETEAQRDLLRSMGCHSFQGFLTARPAPREVVEPYLQLAGR